MHHRGFSFFFASSALKQHLVEIGYDLAPPVSVCNIMIINIVSSTCVFVMIILFIM